MGSNPIRATAPLCLAIVETDTQKSGRAEKRPDSEKRP